jgi:hypothetical protein
MVQRGITRLVGGKAIRKEHNLMLFATPLAALASLP